MDDKIALEGMRHFFSGRDSLGPPDAPGQLGQVVGNSPGPGVPSQPYLLEGMEPDPSLVPRGSSRQECGTKIRRMRCKVCAGGVFRVLYCGHRLCPRCAKERMRIIFFRLKEVLDRTLLPYGMRWRLITLTLKKTNFKTDVDRAIKGLTKFYHNVLEPNGIGCVARLELSPAGMIHWHLFYGGRYLPQKKLSEEWERLTKDSPVVDIREVKSRSGLLEVCDYLLKFNSVREKRQLEAYYYQIRRRRVFRTFGIFYGKEKRETRTLCPWCGAVDKGYEFCEIMSFDDAMAELAIRYRYRETG